MWRSISRPATLMALAALVLLAGCGSGDQTTSAGALATTPTTTATATTTTPAPTTTAAARCASAAFSSNPEDLASDVRSTGLGCPEAEALVRKVGLQMNSSDGPSRVETDGFACIRTSLRSGDHGPPLGTVECARGGTTVTFVRAFVA